MVVPVLTTSCHVSLKSNNGPVSAHAMTTKTASMKTVGRPVLKEIHLAKRENGGSPLGDRCSL